MKSKIILINVLIMAIFSSCSPSKEQTAPTSAENGWKQEVAEKLPLLGHRNWIVVTDMAYPLQTKPGITTIYAGAPYAEIIDFVNKQLQAAPHVYAHVYQDKELSSLKEEFCPGIDAFRKSIYDIIPQKEITSEVHEDLIAKLDSVSAVYQVLIIKSNLTLPYTTTFFQLDCKYWNKQQQDQLQQATEK